MLFFQSIINKITEAIALAKRVLPVPGGPYKSTPFHGFLTPVKISGYKSGQITASSKAYFALKFILK
jgi:hypothetical protein